MITDDDDDDDDDESHFLIDNNLYEMLEARCEGEKQTVVKRGLTLHRILNDY